MRVDMVHPLEVRVDPHAPPGNFLPALARLLRRLRDRERQAEAALAAAPAPSTEPAGDGQADGGEGMCSGAPETADDGGKF